MRRILGTFIAIGFLTSAVLSFTAMAHDFKKGALYIDHPWSRETPKGATVAAGYLIVENRGSAVDRFVSISTDIAGRSEIHEMAVVDGVMRMRPLPKGVEIAPGMSARFEPSGLHLMFLDLRNPLTKGDRFKATLHFETAGAIEVEFVVEAMGTSEKQHSH